MRWEGVVVHQSASDFGDARTIDGWHRARGWSGIGYHYVILNGRRTSAAAYDAQLDGKVEPGRPPDRAGAHVPEANRTHLGICLIGNGTHYLTMAQVASLLGLIMKLKERYGFGLDQVRGHREFSSAQAQGKTCPGFDCAKLRGILVRMSPRARE